MINSLSTGHTCMAYPKDTTSSSKNHVTYFFANSEKKGTFWNQKDLKLYVIAHKMNNFKAEVA